MINNKWNCFLKIIVYISDIIILFYFLFSYFHKSSNTNSINLEYKDNIPKENKKIIVYSCLIGDYDYVTSFNKQNGYDYALFTDQNIVNTNWTILPIPKEVQDLNVTDVKKHRYIKIHPHKFFKNYDLSIYIDANYVIKGNLDDFLNDILNPLDIIYITHLKFGRGIGEAIALAKYYKLDNHDLLNNILGRYKNEKLLDKLGIVNAGLIVRKHNKEYCITLMNKWWEEVEKYSHVDNIAFNYAGYMTGIRFLYISYQLSKEYFGHNKHLKKINY